MSDSEPRAGLSRTTLIGLVAVFVGPLLLAAILYAYHDKLPIPAAKTHGQLIHPVRPLEAFAARTLGGEPMSLDDLRGKWTLVYVGGSHCNLPCEASLFKTRQVRLALGESMSRVQRLYLLTDEDGIDELQQLLETHARMTTAALEDVSREVVLQTFGERPQGNVYIIDPLGNVMMRYAPDATSKGMLKDLKHLLKVSQIG